MGAFVLSATLHSVVIAVLLLFSYVATQEARKAPGIFTVVAGNDFSSASPRKARLSHGVKFELPAPVVDKLTKAEQPPAAKPEPMTTPPVVPASNKAAPISARSSPKIKNEPARMTKQEFDRRNKVTTPNPKTSRVAPVDARNIAKDLVDDSPSKKVRGTDDHPNDTHTSIAAWEALLAQRVKASFELPVMADETLKVSISFFCSADGRFSDFRVRTSSGNQEFDNAVIAAIRKTPMPARPDSTGQTVTIAFSTHDLAH